jgi:hydroxymethylpyrimidine/phosphomethylpyrimidine kinase
MFFAGVSPKTMPIESIAYAAALSIAGFDPSGGAGILADLKTFSAHGIYGQACITGLTVQSTAGVKEVRALDADWVAQTLAELASDNSFSVIKIGALFSSEIVEVVAEFLRVNPGIPLVCDPVIRATSGTELLDLPGIHRLRGQILPKCWWITPNWAELAALAERTVSNRAEAEQAGRQFRASFPQAVVLVTGGDQDSPDDLLLAPGCPPQWVHGERVETTSTHGTGCTLSSALASRLVLYPDELPVQRVEASKRYVEGAMRHAPRMGRGHGPLNHFWKYELCGDGECNIRRGPDGLAVASGVTKRRM